MKRKEVPKYVIKMLKRRTKAAQALRDASIAVDEYCESIGIDVYHPLYDDACLSTDVRIWCEGDGAEGATLAIIEKVLNGETE